MFKTTTVVIPKNILIKIKHLRSNEFLIWLFGPLCTVKVVISKVFALSTYYGLLLLIFDISSSRSFNKKTAYCESVAHLLKFGFINNSRSYVCYLRIKGVGYKMEHKSSNILSIVLGYSHKLNIKIPTYIKVCILKKRVVLWSYSLMRLQQFCSVLIGLRKRDPYNGKGILQPHLQKKLKIGKVSRI